MEDKNHVDTEKETLLILKPEAGPTRHLFWSPI